MSLYYKIKKALYPDGVFDYSPQFRIECRSRNADNPDALAIQIADPLWMLGRQWQFGEFLGEDNGSPTKVSAYYLKEKIQQYSLGKSEQKKDLKNIPLEPLVESMEIEPTDLRSQVRVGQQYERLIRGKFSQVKAKQFIKDLRSNFTLENKYNMDDQSNRFFRLMSGKVIGGGALWRNIKNKSFPNEGSLDNAFAELKSETSKLKEWYKTLFVQGFTDSAWQPDRLVHKFNLHNESKFKLSAPDYQSGHLDWFSFDEAKVNGELIEDPNNYDTLKDLIPVNVSFSSMPDKRLFSFEDNQIDLSLMDVDTGDLIKMMLLDFSLVSGSDWYTIPIEMELGELCWINKIEVKDVFGVTTEIINDGDKGAVLRKDALKVWDIFKIRASDALRKRAENQLYLKEEHFMFLTPASTMRLESEPIEEILFLRDEYANMVWALERKIQNGMGKPKDGFDLHLELYGPFQKDEESDNENGLPKFRLATTVPTNWIPYLPSLIQGEGQNIELRRAYMMRNEVAAEPADIKPLTYLADKDLLAVREEAIPRAGVRIQLTKQRIRWVDGKTYIWMGRKVLAGRGEGNSGLAFDQLIE